MRDPRSYQLVRDFSLGQHLAQDLQASRELATHDAVLLMGCAKRAACIFDVGSKPHSGVLIFEIFDSTRLSSLEHEPDHEVVKAAIDECVDDGPKPRQTADLVDLVHGPLCIAPP